MEAATYVAGKLHMGHEHSRGKALSRDSNRSARRHGATFESCPSYGSAGNTFIQGIRVSTFENSHATASGESTAVLIRFPAVASKKRFYRGNRSVIQRHEIPCVRWLEQWSEQLRSRNIARPHQSYCPFIHVKCRHIGIKRYAKTITALQCLKISCFEIGKIVMEKIQFENDILCDF